jgi:hypothetical protein
MTYDRPLEIITACPTRWSSDIKAATRLLQLKNALMQVLADKGIEMLSADEWSQVCVGQLHPL